MHPTAHNPVWLGSPGSLAPALCAVLAVLVEILGWGPLSARGERITLHDEHGDACVRRTDVGADGPVGEGLHQLPDLISVSVGTWRPSNPQNSLFTGTWSNMGEFFRLDLILDGLVNPPGPCACCGQPLFEPFRYGPNPLNGYVEINVDADFDTGGELDWPELRYLGNTSRFGGLPPGASTGGRVAMDARAFDEDLSSSPFVERSGEDFHLELVGWEISSDQIQRSDVSDWLFGAGETWVITAHLFHRAHGYSPFCSACCRSGVSIGNYEPLVKVQFSHHVLSDRTTVSLVYPLTQAASASITGDLPELMDPDFTNQNSLAEALWELNIMASTAPTAQRAMPEFALIAPWESKNPDAFLDPSGWQIRALLGGSYTAPQDGLFVWSDVFPDVLLADFDGNGTVGPDDLSLFDLYLQANDGDPELDADNLSNGSIEIVNFGPGFSLYDLNYDGLVDGDDRALVGGPLLPRADFDHDGDVDQSDFGHLQLCLSDSSPPARGCRNADLNRNGHVDQDDVGIFSECAAGPAVPADPACGRP